MLPWPMEHLSWWKESAIYHIYPRSFADSDGDGIGDLKGIMDRLSYIQRLGAKAIWMGPVFRSPQVDNGYDVSDYRDVDPLFGTLADLEHLIEEAHRLGIRVLLDLVFNHTSDQHPWFRAATEGSGSRYNDYYVWRDPAPDGAPPNDWRSFFSIPAWTFHETRGQYYLHLFTPEQPDLNWENPEVRREMADIANFWLARGADGFRLDVINMISKKPGLPSLGGASPSGIYVDGPQVLPYIQELRSRMVTNREIALVGETPRITPSAARSYTDPRNAALNIVLLFDHLEVDHGPSGRWEHRAWTTGDLAGVIATWQQHLAAPSWPSIYLSNHDQPRIVSRYGSDLDYRYQSATALATVFYLQRGTPVVYQGEEIGMCNFPLESPDQIMDVESKNAYLDLVESAKLTPQEAIERVRHEARDNSRTPMQWSGRHNAGFSDASPWYPPNPDYHEWNVEAQEICHEAATSSVLCYYRALLALRRSYDALLQGDYVPLAPACVGASPGGPPPGDDFPPTGGTVFAFLRRLSSQAGTSQLSTVCLVAANLSDVPASWNQPTVAGLGGTFVLWNYPDGPRVRPQDQSPARAMAKGNPWRLRPWECVVLV